MTDLEQRVCQAFDEVVAPESVKRETLAYLACRAAQLESAAQESAEPVPPAASEHPARRRSGAFRAFTFRKAVAAAAACLVVAALGIGGFTAYAQPTAYVGIDVNPSVELCVNRFGLVVETRALNDDGRALLEGVSLEGLGYAEALAALTQSDAFAPYAQEGSFVEINVASDDERQAEELRSQSDACLKQLPCRGSCHAVDEETWQAANAAGMGVGRYRAALELMELDPEVTLEECETMSMRELRDRIAAASGEPSFGQGSGGGAGAGHGSGRGHGEGHGAGRGRGMQ
ncbi:anti-sigma-I factor RsgI family protein [Arabiibacter massiliensis]|uniref:anti-sigma-I factor RsgI family protein n=1 Tax=Arabiibacter massiliensis TaxID=1870985 RepID=UPI0009BA8BFA|nr:hypothetical protein [Arabiibacter massiliensis]